MDTIDRLVSTTQQLLWERGYVGTSPKAIQKLSGVGQGSMYHHFVGKAELAAAAMERSAAGVRDSAESALGSRKSPLRRIAAYLGRQREVLRGCPVGRMAFDPDVIVDDTLRQPLQQTFAWLTERLAEIVAEGQAAGEIDRRLNPAATAAAIAAVVQGGYVLARSAGTQKPFDDAVKGMLALLQQPPH